MSINLNTTRFQNYIISAKGQQKEQQKQNLSFGAVDPEILYQIMAKNQIVASISGGRVILKKGKEVLNKIISQKGSFERDGSLFANVDGCLIKFYQIEKGLNAIAENLNPGDLLGYKTKTGHKIIAQV